MHSLEDTLTPAVSSPFVCDARVAISATHVALRNLGVNALPPKPVSGQSGDQGRLPTALAMVEVEHSDVGFAAVNAWVGDQVLGEVFMRRLSRQSPARDDHTNVMLPILGVVLASMALVALSADPLQAVFATRRFVELTQRQIPTAFPTVLHEEIFR
ncbi:hypothetical protein [Gryllotalpicola koreensis]|uniref:hypothetical protein n=1 Tax=Gryllotalpicola koreensis TaxID=993086 RepID=UPI0031CE166C